MIKKWKRRKDEIGIYESEIFKSGNDIKTIRQLFRQLYNNLCDEAIEDLKNSEAKGAAQQDIKNYWEGDNASIS